MPRRVSVGDEVLTLMAEALHFKPVTLAFPEDQDQVDTLALELVDESALVEQLQNELPVEDLLNWLHKRYPDLTDATLLRLYHALVDRTEWQVSLADAPVAVMLHTVRVTHFPHALQPSGKSLVIPP